MKCPKCSREISDKALFCGYCGTTIEKYMATLTESEMASSISREANGVSCRIGTEQDKLPTHIIETIEEPKKKKKIGLKILLGFSILAILSGGIFGFAVARGILDWRNYLPTEKFAWTDKSESVVQISEDGDADEDSKESKKIDSAEEKELVTPEVDAPNETAAIPSVDSVSVP